MMQLISIIIFIYTITIKLRQNVCRNEDRNEGEADCR